MNGQVVDRIVDQNTFLSLLWKVVYYHFLLLRNVAFYCPRLSVCGIFARNEPVDVWKWYTTRYEYVAWQS